jgi:hypothetical protein
MLLKEWVHFKEGWTLCSTENNNLKVKTQPALKLVDQEVVGKDSLFHRKVMSL